MWEGKKVTINFWSMYCIVLQLSYLQVGTPRQHYNSPSNDGFSISEDIVILMSRFLYNPDISTMPGQFVVQILYNAMIVGLHRIQAGDKLR